MEINLLINIAVYFSTLWFTEIVFVKFVASGTL